MKGSRDFRRCGFIGSYLTEELLKREYSVIVADIKQNQYTEKAEFVYCDITSPEQIAQAIPENTDYIYNFAGSPIWNARSNIRWTP
mgnify:FL=1